MNSVLSFRIVPLVPVLNGVVGVHLLNSVYLEVMNMPSVHKIVSMVGYLTNWTKTLVKQSIKIKSINQES